jgi:hypothetical protein
MPADGVRIPVRSGRWTYLYRAAGQHGQVIDVLLSQRRDLTAARRFFRRALRAGTIPAEATTDRVPAYPRVLDDLIPAALHVTERYANNRVETDHGRLKARLRPMRGLNVTGPPGSWPPDTRSCRTSAAAATNSLPTSLTPPAPRRLRPAHGIHLRSQLPASSRWL